MILVLIYTYAKRVLNLCLLVPDLFQLIHVHRVNQPIFTRLKGVYRRSSIVNVVTKDPD